MKRLRRAWTIAVAGLAACQIQVAAPDLSGLLGDSGSGLDFGADVPPIPELPAEDRIGDPGGRDPGPEAAPEDRLEDPSRDPGNPEDSGGDVAEDLYEEPRIGNVRCRTGGGCVSGICKEGFCRCDETWHCEAGDWCDGGSTAVRDSGLCLPRRGLTAGCRFHEQCQTGACDPTGYCAWCAPGGAGCEEAKVCCFGVCREGCLGCAVAPPPAPVYTACATGCYEAEKEFCGPNGGEPKRPNGSDCQFNDSWCQSGVCFSEDLRESACADCHDDADCVAMHGGGVCLGGYCAIP
ncbi:hypothetical protein KBD49_14915 [Myxococcota bacterium]|nr:hypothetical protein [Myxococcota bacterium]